MPSTVVPGVVLAAGASAAPCSIGIRSGPSVPPPGWVGPVADVAVVGVVCELVAVPEDFWLEELLDPHAATSAAQTTGASAAR